MLWLLSLPLGGLVYSIILQMSTLIYYGSSQPKKKLKNQDEKREKKKNFYTPFSWFMLISGTGLVLACQSDFDILRIWVVTKSAEEGLHTVECQVVEISAKLEREYDRSSEL